MFGKNTPAKVGIELVVKGIPEDILEIQAYLSDSEFEIVEARAVTEASLSFATKPYRNDSSKVYLPTVEELIKRDYPALRLLIKIQELGNGYNWEGNEGSYCSGLISGGVEDVLKLRKLLMMVAESFATSIFRQSVTFS